MNDWVSHYEKASYLMIILGITTTVNTDNVETEMMAAKYNDVRAYICKHSLYYRYRMLTQLKEASSPLVCTKVRCDDGLK